MRDPILITGAARSGTSMVAGVVEMCGAFGGKTCGPTLGNRRGQFENDAIRNSIVKPYLVLQGWDPMAQNPLPDVHNLLPFDNLRQRVEEIMRQQGYRSGPWYYKCAKACLIWPIWHKAFPNAKWIIVRRKKEDIVSSCLRTAFMRKYKTAEGWSRWVDEHIRRFDEMKAQDMWTAEVWPHQFVYGDFVEMYRVIDQIGLSWDAERVVEFVTPALWHAKEGR